MDPGKGPADYLELGDWNARCSLCGRKRKASELVRNWQGMWRCPEHNEPRQPQDFVRPVADIISVPFVQPTLITYAPFGNCGPNGMSALCGIAICGCAQCGYISPSLDLTLI